MTESTKINVAGLNAVNHYSDDSHHRSAQIQTRSPDNSGTHTLTRGEASLKMRNLLALRRAPEFNQQNLERSLASSTLNAMNDKGREIIRLLGEDNIEQALQNFGELQREGIDSNHPTITSIRKKLTDACTKKLAYYSSLEQVSRATRLRKEIISYGIRPNQEKLDRIYYENKIFSCIERGDWDKVSDLYHQANLEGIAFSDQTAKDINHTDKANTDKAERLLSTLSNK